ncbi:hypothetical protein GCM10009765_64670 [Fodinicola feengrottensis]|uniref:Uncharacterized protein n=2 Tax=Fodinicola feengrottensis TaxID=435914 RepID=A0ABN2IJY3_9ACTN
MPYIMAVPYDNARPLWLAASRRVARKPCQSPAATENVTLDADRDSRRAGLELWPTRTFAR